MIWVVAYRGDGENPKQLATSGRAAAIVAAVGMIERGVEVLSVTDEEKTKSVSEDEIRRVGELSHAPSIQFMFKTGQREALVASQPSDHLHRRSSPGSGDHSSK